MPKKKYVPSSFIIRIATSYVHEEVDRILQTIDFKFIESIKIEMPDFKKGTTLHFSIARAVHKKIDEKLQEENN